MTEEIGLSRPLPDAARFTVALHVGDQVRRRAIAQMLTGLGASCQEASSRSVPDLRVVSALTNRSAEIAGLRAGGYQGPILVLSAHGSLNRAIAAMKAGASDVAPWPLSLSGLEARISALLAAPGETSAPSDDGFEGLIGSSPAMKDVYDRMPRLAASKAPVFITGESGTGKELVAQAIHRLSGRDPSRLVVLNCGAIPRDLMEAELFGHVKGAFTGANEDRKGAAELADGGTLFLDEIGELDIALQSKLLRLVQTGEARRIGEGQARQVDVRFICATHRDIARDVTEGRFREDLYYRLYVLPLHLPSLSERNTDILTLARHFLARFAAEEGRKFTGFEPQAEALLLSCSWPGNVRQLQNVIRRLVVMQDGETVTAPMLPLALAHGSWVGGRPETPMVPRAQQIEPFHVQERRIIEEALALFDGNLARAAAALELSPSTLYRKKEQWLHASRTQRTG
jgi:two-component system repressor protein LuxO